MDLSNLPQVAMAFRLLSNSSNVYNVQVPVMYAKLLASNLTGQTIALALVNATLPSSIVSPVAAPSPMRRRLMQSFVPLSTTGPGSEAGIQSDTTPTAYANTAISASEAGTQSDVTPAVEDSVRPSQQQHDPETSMKSAFQGLAGSIVNSLRGLVKASFHQLCNDCIPTIVSSSSSSLGSTEHAQSRREMLAYTSVMLQPAVNFSSSFQPTCTESPICSTVTGLEVSAIWVSRFFPALCLNSSKILDPVVASRPRILELPT